MPALVRVRKPARGPLGELGEQVAGFDLQVGGEFLAGPAAGGVGVHDRGDAVAAGQRLGLAGGAGGEAKEEVLGVSDVPSSTVTYIGVPESGQPRSEPAEDSSTGPDKDLRISRVTGAIQELEWQLATKLVVGLRNAKVETAARVGDHTVDILAVDEKDRKGYAFDLKYVSTFSMNNLRNRLVESVALASAAVKLSEGYGFPFTPVLLVVVADSAGVPRRELVSERLGNISAAMSVGVRVVLLTRSAFADLTPAELLKALAPSDEGLKAKSSNA